MLDLRLYSIHGILNSCFHSAVFQSHDQWEFVTNVPCVQRGLRERGAAE